MHQFAVLYIIGSNIRHQFEVGKVEGINLKYFT